MINDTLALMLMIDHPEIGADIQIKIYALQSLLMTKNLDESKDIF